MMSKAARTRIDHYEEQSAEAKLDLAIEILMKKFEISERDAKSKIALLSRAKNLDTEKTCEVLIRLEKIINESWFEASSTR
jgi:hypothetical protein